MSLIDRLRPDSSGAPVRRSDVGPDRGRDHGRHAGDGGRAGEDGPVTLVVALLTGAWSAALSWVAIALPALLAWATSTQTTAGWTQAARIATDVWLVVHRVGVAVPGGSIGLLPMAGAALPAWLCWVGGRRIGAGLPPGPGPVLRRAAPTLLALAVGYALVLVVGALAAAAPGARPSVPAAAVTGLVLPLVSGGAAALRASGEPVGAALADLLRLPDVVRRAVRPGLLAAALLVAGSAALLAVVLATSLERITTLHHALDAGVVGGGVLTLAQLTLLPNLAVWAVSFVGGTGFAVGVGTTVAPGGSDVGLLPLVPVLGALPQPGPLPTALWVLPLVPVVCGAVAGWLAVRGRTASGLLGALAQGAAAGGVAALALTVLVVLSGGSAGPGRLGEVGPTPWRTGLVLLVELTAGALVGALVTHRRAGRAGGDTLVVREP